MKRLNKKGFTLVELLAVIIILAVVVGITIPTVLSVTDNAKKKAFETAVDAIQTYVQSQVDMSQLSPEFRTEDTPYDSSIAEGWTANTQVADKGAYVIEKTGYKGNITDIRWTIDAAGKVTINCATVDTKGDYVQPNAADTPNKYKACPAN